MDPIEYLRGLARRWRVVVAAFVVALAAGGLTMLTPQAAPAPTGPVPGAASYEATAILLAESGNNKSSGPNLKTVAALITVGKLPDRVAKALDFQGKPSVLAQQVRVEPDLETGILRITAVAGNAEQAKLIADTFANELVGFLMDRKRDQLGRGVDALTKGMSQLKGEIAALDSRIASSTATQQEVLRSERDAKVRLYGTLYEQYLTRTSTVLEDPGLQVIEQASPVEATAASGAISAPQTPVSRLLFAGIGGLVAGVVIALVLERTDTRIRTKQAAEVHFGLPVLAEIPLNPKGRKRESGVEVAAAPTSPWADAFRLLEAGVSRHLPSDGLAIAKESPNGEMHQGRSYLGLERSSPARPRGHTILVTSPDRAEGKTTVVANLAATYAELGKEVLILSCDLRHPRVHEPFGIPNDPGLTQALQSSSGGSVLDGTIHTTWVSRVRLVPSGPVPEKPSELLASANMESALEQARREADVVLLDTPPLFNSDAAHLLSRVDGVLVVARMGQTKAGPAERAGELLRRLGASVVGVALNASGGAGIMPGHDPGRARRRRVARSTPTGQGRPPRREVKSGFQG